MANFWWTSVDGDWASPHSWTTDGGDDTPQSEDVVIFNGIYSNVSVTSGLNQTAGNDATYDTDLSYLFVDDTYTGDIGTSGSPLQLTADKIVFKGSGSFYFKSDSDAGGAITDHIVINSDNLSDAAFLDSDGNNDTITSIVVVKGDVTIQGSMGLLTRLGISYRKHPKTDARVHIESCSNAVNWAYCAGGVVDCNRACSMDMSGGQWTQDIDNFTTVHQHGGTIIYNTPQSAGNISQLWLTGGTFDMTRNGNRKTINAAYIFPDGDIEYNEDLHTITFHDMTGTNQI